MLQPRAESLCTRERVVWLVSAIEVSRPAMLGDGRDRWTLFESATGSVGACVVQQRPRLRPPPATGLVAAPYEIAVRGATVLGQPAKERAGVEQTAFLIPML